MSKRRLSQRTLVEMMEALEEYGQPTGEMDDPGVNFTRYLYKRDFETWFVLHAESGYYRFNWERIIIDLRSGKFFFPAYADERSNVTGKYLSDNDADRLGEYLNQRLAAVAAMTPYGESVRRSLELDGFRINERTGELEPFDSIVSEQEEESRVVALIKQSGIANSEVILKHLSDAQDLFVQGKDHPSINESRSFVQALIDNIGVDTHAHGGHSRGFPAGTTNRLEYLQAVNFLTEDEQKAFGSAWGFLCGGSHPGVPPHELAHIALILSLEFGQLLLLKFANWSANGYKQFLT
jgi:hypothetical protein